MIICPNTHHDFPNDWILAKQSDHDDHAGYLSAQWASDEFWTPTDPRMLTLAVAMHDTGSATWEDHPPVSPQGIPWTFWTMPPEDHIELHRKGVAVAREVHPYVALLISMHTVGIHRDRMRVDTQKNRWHMPEHFSDKVNAFVSEQTELQERLIAEIEALRGKPFPREDLMNDYRIFQMLDILSTQFPCTGLQDREMEWVPDRQGQPKMIAITRAGEWEMRIAPYPFTGDRFDCPLPGRRIPKQVFKNNEEYHAAYYAAHPVTLPYALVR